LRLPDPVFAKNTVEGLELAKYGIRDFSNWCANTLTTEDGRPLRIEAFQRKLLSDLHP